MKLKQNQINLKRKTSRWPRAAIDENALQNKIPLCIIQYII